MLQIKRTVSSSWFVQLVRSAGSLQLPSLTKSLFRLQQSNAIKGDWVSTVLRDISELEIYETIEEIKAMPRTKFKKLIENRIEKKALEDLQTKRSSEGKEKRYTTLEMSELLLPFNSKLNIEEKRKLFEKRNKMTEIPYNFGQKEENAYEEIS